MEGRTLLLVEVSLARVHEMWCWGGGQLRVLSVHVRRLI